MSSYVKTKFDYITLQVHNLSSSPSWKGKPSFQPSLPGGCSSLSYPKQEGVHQEVWCYFLQDKTVQMMGIYIHKYIYIHLYYVYKWIVYFPNKLGASCTPSHRWDKTEAILVCFWDSLAQGQLPLTISFLSFTSKNSFTQETLRTQICIKATTKSLQHMMRFQQFLNAKVPHWATPRAVLPPAPSQRSPTRRHGWVPWAEEVLKPSAF